jgi:hypothetical protein
VHRTPSSFSSRLGDKSIRCIGISTFINVQVTLDRDSD